MQKKLVIGTAAFAVVSLVLGLGVQAAGELVPAPSSMVSLIGTHLLATPLALIAGRRVGRVTHLSILITSALLAAAALGLTVYILSAIAVPAGGHVGWETLFNPMNRKNTVVGIATALLVPQLWLLLLDRMATRRMAPLRGAA